MCVRAAVGQGRDSMWFETYSGVARRVVDVMGFMDGVSHNRGDNSTLKDKKEAFPSG